MPLSRNRPTPMTMPMAFGCLSMLARFGRLIDIDRQRHSLRRRPRLHRHQKLLGGRQLDRGRPGAQYQRQLFLHGVFHRADFAVQRHAFHFARAEIADGYHAGDPLDQERRGGHRQLDSSCGSRPFIFDFDFDRDGFTAMEHLITILVSDDCPEYHRGRLVHWNRHRNGYRRMQWSRLGTVGLACLSGIDNIAGRSELLGHPIRHISPWPLGQSYRDPSPHTKHR